jgi:multiple sugar transport system ATP-binding protein
MAEIGLHKLRKSYPGGQVAVRDLDLTVVDGELLVLVGPSGCGKTTTLRLVAGLDTPTGGRITLGGEDVTEQSPQDRDLAMVFQSYALYPHMTVRENLAFGLRMRGLKSSEIAARVEEGARLLGLGELLDRKPRELSGGQRQRVALGRALVRKPRAFLLDEPLSNLDARLRVRTRAELLRLRDQLGATMLYVTHDQEEAMTLGDRIAVMKDGSIQQCGPPLQVYRRPASVFVARFIGSPEINLLEAELTAGPNGPRVEAPGFSLDLERTAIDGMDEQRILLGVRPQDIALVSPSGADVTARVQLVEALGTGQVIHATVAEGGELRIAAPAEPQAAVGDRLGLQFLRPHLHLFDAATSRRLGSAD